MKLSLDRYAYLKSPIHSWQQEYKLVGLLSLIFAFSFVKNLVLLPVIIIIALVLFCLSRLPLSYLRSRLRYPGWFILAVVCLLPFTAGQDVIWQYGWLSIKQEGCRTALMIVVRFLCILTVSIVLFGTAPFLRSIKALQALGLPRAIVDMTLLAYRYLEELGETLNRMQRAIRLRGFQHEKINRRQLQVTASLVGSLFVRSYERSHKIYHAMILRGYGSQSVSKRSFWKQNLSQTNYSHLCATVICLLLAGIILVIEGWWL